MRKEERLGEARMMNCGEIAIIVNYACYNDITVQFKKTGELVKTRYSHFKNGFVKSRFTPSVCGVGIIGNEKTKDENGETIKSYSVWTSMLKRCYSDKCQKKQPTYKGCCVCEEWLNYSNFKKWFNDNYYEIEGEQMNLDKDILVKGNKIYSPETCVFVPKKINTLFVKSNKVIVSSRPERSPVNREKRPPPKKAWCLLFNSGVFFLSFCHNRSRGLGAVRGLSIGRGCADCPPCFT